jgi:hypothetical protein
MLARILRAADPAVTAADGRLRFEAFSQCCGVYARADLLPDMLSVETCGKGTTNVDFNAPMRAALAQVREPWSLDLRVTPERAVVGTSRGTIVQRKVKLPMRWLKGFAEVQALATALVHSATLSGPVARWFLSAIPREVKARDQVWLLPATGGLRASQHASANAIASAGLGRLQAMKPLARHAESLRIYARAHETRAFELDFGVARFMLVLSAAARGFSGEGLRPRVRQALAGAYEDAAHSSPLALLVVRAALERALHPGTPTCALRDVHPWLETPLELAIEAGEAIEDPKAREGLHHYLNGGKVKEPAQALLDLKPSRSRNVRCAARRCFWLSTAGRPALTCSEELQSIRANTCSRFAKNRCHPPLAPW